MLTPALIKNKKKPATAREKATFDRLRRKIEGLQHKIQETEKQYEQALQLYHSHLAPKEKQIIDLITQFIVKVREITRDPKALNKRERAALKDLLQDDLDILTSMVFPTDLHDEVKSLYKELHNESVEKSLQDGFSDLKNQLCEEGITQEEDWADLDFGNSWQDIFKNLGQTIFEKNLHEDQHSNSSPPKPKTKKELLKEEKARQIEEWKNKGIGAIYKRLAKVLHPDLEQDAEKRIEKDLLMKRLTIAYEQRDLLVLLELESKWLDHLGKDSETSTQEKLTVYNSLLKDQIQDLEDELRLIGLNPRYFELHSYQQKDQEGPFEMVRQIIVDAEDMIQACSKRLKDISEENPLEMLKTRLKQLIDRDDDPNFLDLDQLEFLDLLMAMQQLNSEANTGRRKKKKR